MLVIFCKIYMTKLYLSSFLNKKRWFFTDLSQFYRQIYRQVFCINCTAPLAWFHEFGFKNGADWVAVVKSIPFHYTLWNTPQPNFNLVIYFVNQIFVDNFLLYYCNIESPYLNAFTGTIKKYTPLRVDQSYMTLNRCFGLDGHRPELW